MAIFDVREEWVEEITQIIFWDDNPNFYEGFYIQKSGSYGEAKTRFSIADGNTKIEICNKEHAENLIKAIRKAIELGWVK